MTWRAVVSRDDIELSCPKAETATPRGSLMVETLREAEGAPHTIFEMPLSAPEAGSLSLKSVPGGGIVVVIQQGDDISHSTVSFDAAERLDRLRITYSWDVVAGVSRLAVEQPEKQTARWSHGKAPVAISASDICTFAQETDIANQFPDFVFAAVSDQVEPVGPSPSLSLDTPLETTFGTRPLAEIRRADPLICGGDKGSQIVLAKVERIVPAFGSFAPIRLRAPYFGLSQDLIVAPDQRLLIDGSEVEYTFGCEKVLVSARHLVNGYAARWEGSGPLMRYGQCVLPEHEPLDAAGQWIESMFVGRIRRNDAMRRETLLGPIDPMFLPEQARAPYRVLSPFEAITLAERRAA